MPGVNEFTACLECGARTPIVGVGAFRTCDACVAARREREAVDHALSEHERALAFLRTLPGGEAQARDLERRMADVVAARQAAAQREGAARAYRQRDARRTAALERITMAALTAAEAAVRAEHEADPDLWRAEWGYSGDVRHGGSVNVPDAVRDASTHLGRITLTFERVRR